MTASITWVQIGDLHMDEADGWQSRDRLERIVAQINTHVGAGADFVFLPGDNANHATPEQYRVITAALAPLRTPVRVITGDHDFELGHTDHFEAAFSSAERAEVEVIAGHRCIFLDVISPGAGGPDFRVTMHHRNRLLEELARAEAEGQVPLVFMHAYPGDLAADGAEIARIFADARVAFVATGHTHYNEVLNDGRVIYAATRSTGQIEEDDGCPGFAITCVHGSVPSWRFRRLDDAWPHVQIVAPCDIRLVTRPADPHQVPRPGLVRIAARVFGDTAEAEMEISVDGGPAEPMWFIDSIAQADIRIDLPGLHRIEVTCGTARDCIDLLVRDADEVPKRRLPVALGQDCHAIGAWPQAGLLGTQLGPNKNGMGW